VIRTSYSTWQDAVRAIAATFNAKRTGKVTLTASATTTTVLDSRVGYSSVIVLTPLTANAAAENPYISNITNGNFTITHSNTAATDKDFNYVVEV